MNMQKINEQEKQWLLDEKYAGVTCDEYEKECRLIENGVPVAYLIGNIEFLGCQIDLSNKPLIPRAETEFWVDIFLRTHKLKISQEKHILDLFAGSGCIGIAIAYHTGCHIDLGEIDQKNIQQIQKNIELNNIMNAHTFETDVFSNIPKKKYQFILANPPYIDRNKSNQVQDSVLENEDDHALFARQQGLEFIFRLIDEGVEYLESQGEIWIEFDSWQVEAIDSYLSQKEQWAHKYIKDQYGKDRVLVLIKKLKIKKM